MFSFSVFAQKSDSAALKTVEFVSPILDDGKIDPNPIRKNCFSFITESSDCRQAADLYYGNVRAGNEWDWLQAMGTDSRNRIKKLGKKTWTEEFEVPVIEPYAKLGEGERRLIAWDVSGQDGEDGKPGMNADGIPNDESNVTVRELPTRKTETKKIKSDYHPYEKAVRGNMYAMRVVDDKNDFYVLFRVDELERGKRCKISWKRIEAPAGN